MRMPMRLQFRIFNRDVGVTWVRILQVELTPGTLNKSSGRSDAGQMLDRRQRRRFIQRALSFQEDDKAILLQKPLLSA
jgi:hypothetical protein